MSTVAKPTNRSAPADHPVNELIQNRWSPRAYSDRPVERRLLAQLFEAARWAPSSSNEQPWSFVFGEKGSEGYQRIFDALVPFNQGWVKSVPVLAIGLARKHSSRDGAVNNYALYDLGQAVAQLAVEATAQGLVVHQMAGFDHDKARTNLNVPETHHIGSVMAIGYWGDPNSLPETIKDRELAPRTRYPLEKFVFEGTFGQAVEFKKP